MRHPTFQPSFQCICLFCTWWHMVFDQQMCDIFMRAYGSSTDICVWLCYVHWEETIVSKRKAIKPVQLKSRICYELLYIQFQTSLWSPSYFVKSELNHYEVCQEKLRNDHKLNTTFYLSLFLKIATFQLWKYSEMAIIFTISFESETTSYS